MKHPFSHSSHTQYIGYVALILCLIVPHLSGAATYTIDVPTSAVAPQSEFLARVWVNTEEESLNAFAGTLTFPAELLEATAVRDVGSILPVWVDRPHLTTPGSIPFSGITPGGFKSDHAYLFTIVFRAKKEGAPELSLRNVEALKNDGSGTPTRTTSSGARLVISPNVPTSSVEEIVDLSPPEKFSAELVQVPESFDGKAVLIFATQDKGSGVSHYSVCEGLFASCVSATSPYELRNQRTDSLIMIYATDNAGHVRRSHLLPTAAVVRYSIYGVFVLVLAILGRLSVRRWRSRR